MKEITLSFLDKIINKNPDNYFAKGVLQIISKESTFSKRKFIDTIPIPNDGLEEEQADNEIKTEKKLPIEERPFCDYRFNSFRLNGFRKFPYDDKKDYGIDFTKKNIQNVSLFLIGSNGSGKTTIFSGLEYLCTGKISAAEQRNVQLGNDYLNYGKDKGKTFKLALSTVQEDVESNQSKSKEFNEISYLLRPFFCSENDILEISSYKQDLTHFIYDQTGLKMSTDLLQQLKEEREEARETIDSYNKYGTELQKSTLKPEIQESMIAFLDKLTIESFDLWEHWSTSGCKEVMPSETFAIDSQLWNSQIPNESENKKGAVDELKNRVNRYLPSLKEGQDKFYELFPHGNSMLNLYSNFIERCETVTGQKSSAKSLFSSIQPYNKGIEEQYNQLKNISFEDFEVERKFYYEKYLACQKAFLSGDNEKKAEFLMEIYSEKNILTDRLEEYRRNQDESIEAKYKRYNSHYGHLNNLIEGLESQINSRIELFYRIGHRFVEGILESFMEINEKFKLVLTNNQIIPFIEFTKADGTTENFTPREFFNSFRFKMYCLGLKIAVAFSIKKYMNFNFPLILDDVFYSSDFTNREKVEDFIWTLYKVHENIFKEQQELQILFLTHDELLVSAATKSVPYRKPILSGRLFDYREFTTNPNVDDDRQFINLYVPFSV